MSVVLQRRDVGRNRRHTIIVAYYFPRYRKGICGGRKRHPSSLK